MKMKKAAALLLSLVLSASVFAACDKEKAKEKKTSKTTEEESDEEETTAEETTTTEETTETSETTDVFISHLSSYDELTPDEVYEKFRSFAAELEQKNTEAGFYYGFFSHFQDENEIWLLAVSNGVNDYAYYTSVDGEMKDVSEEVGWSMPERGIFPFKQFMRFPCIISLEYHSKIIEFAETLDDGYYNGTILAVSENADKMMVEVWTTPQFTPEEYAALKVGDLVFEDDYTEIYVESIDENGNVILSSEEYWFDKDQSGEDNYVIYDYGMPIKENAMVALVTVDPDCKIEDHYEWLYTEIEGYEDYLNDNPDLTAVEKTLYWYGGSQEQFLFPLGNGWEERPARLNPVVIENDTIVEVCFDFR